METLIFRAQSDFSFHPWKSTVFKTSNSYVYQEFGNQKADEDILSRNFLYIKEENRIHPLVLGFVSTNFRRKINLRYLLGAGLTFGVLKREHQWLEFSISSEIERTEFATADFNRPQYYGDKTLRTIRGTLWISGKHHVVRDRLILNHQSYIQPSLEKRNNFRWRTDIGLEFPVWEFLNLTVNYLQSFESIVVANEKQQDRFLTFGFTLKSY
ncbi:DUF481 domain-containing protein [Rhodohalobacter mucosus]|uniref:DUF481 domain-containing protein n=1 Tax=Rhodohalobacter mucosus TaxID=2079485 RepID=UPI0018EE9C45|nr:DUF481 domain-containing protein [Rhodohalobacter mucosus]